MLRAMPRATVSIVLRFSGKVDGPSRVGQPRERLMETRGRASGRRLQIAGEAGSIPAHAIRPHGAGSKEFEWHAKV